MDTVKIASKQCCIGLCDCVKGVYMMFYLDKKLYDHEMKLQKPNDPPKPFQRKLLCEIFKSVGVSLFLWFSLCLFFKVLPIVKKIFFMVGNESEESFASIEDNLYVLFTVFWLLPLNLLLKAICVFWNSNVSDIVFRMRFGEPRPTAVHKMLADLFYSLIFETLFLLQAIICSTLFRGVAVLGVVVELLHYCLLYSLYAFEYKWSNMGLDLSKRMKILTSKWPYYIGFGFPIFLLNNVLETPYDPFTGRSCIFLATFPFFIVSGTYASAPKTQVYPIPIAMPALFLCDTLFTTVFRRFRRTAHNTSSTR